MTEIWTPAQYRAYLAGGETPAAAPRFLTMDAAAPEEELQGRIQQLCHARDLLYYHARKSKGSTAGFPDVTICHPNGGPLFLWELKRDTEEPGPAQHQWLNAIALATTIEPAVYRPRDWPLIYQLLTRSTP